jgi:hypothetical protein
MRHTPGDREHRKAGGSGWVKHPQRSTLRRCGDAPNGGDKTGGERVVREAQQ